VRDQERSGILNVELYVAAEINKELQNHSEAVVESNHLTTEPLTLPRDNASLKNKINIDNSKQRT